MKWKSVLPLCFIALSCGTSNITSDDLAGENFCHYLDQEGLSLAVSDCQGNKIFDRDVNSNRVAWLTLSSNKADHLRYNGVGRVGNCSGALLDTGVSEGAPAYFLTAAHCLDYQGGYFPSQGVFTDILVSSSVVQFNYYMDVVSADQTLSESVKKITFATMENNDLAILELSSSLEDLKNKGLKAYKISSKAPHKGQLVKLVGVPLSGVTSLGLRKAVCRIGKQVFLEEGDFSFPQSYRHRCSSVGGVSGSPLFDFDSLEIIAVNNTGVNDNSQGQGPCTLNRPCEVKPNGEKSVESLENYGQPVYSLASCFTSSGIFDLNQSNCSLNIE